MRERVDHTRAKRGARFCEPGTCFSDTTNPAAEPRGRRD